ncbi:MAG: LemA family protein [Candidatus Marinimicrobia bacterium]|nr:LemA family protein [Candidatus Neomarinimicrobiota bacterium]
MRSGRLNLLIIGVIIVFLIFYFIGGYNSLVRLEEEVNSAWAQVSNQYQRRADLIPNLVEVVKGYAKHERETFQAVTEARAKATQITLSPEILDNPEAFNKFQQVQGELSSALARLLAVAENYPQLKANENFLSLQAQLEGTENRIAVERRRFNEVVRRYNTRIRRFPTNIIAGLFGFERKAYFKAEQGAEKAPKVQF